MPRGQAKVRGWERVLLGRISEELSVDERQRRVLLFFFMTAGVPVLLAFGILHVINGNTGEGLGNIGAAAVVAAGAVIMRRLRDGTWVFLGITVLLAMNLGSVFVAGGQVGEKGVWMLLLPPIAYFLCGELVGLLCSVGGIGMAVLATVGGGMAPYTPAVMIRIVVAYLVVTVMTHFYERVRGRALRAAQQASAAKDRFLANVSHELRTPMNGVLGMARQLAEEAPEPSGRESAATIQRCAESLVAIIDDILDAALLERGEVVLHQRAVALRRLAEDAVALLAPAAKQKDLALRLELADELPEWVLGDGPRLRQVLLNLLGNAIKFTSAGEVALAIEPAAHGGLGFRVRDTGVGIALKRQQQIFEPFVKLDEMAPGTGLGLAITRQLVEQMGGELELSSSPGKGALFSFSLDLPLAPEPEATTEAAAQPSAPLRALVADDDRTSQHVLKRLLEKRGHTVSVAQNGVEVINTLLTKTFDVVLMDVRMPVLDGISTARRIRSSASDASYREVPIIAVTACTSPDDERRCLEVGMNGFLSKPIAAEALDRTLASLARR